jgi:hypothetical protein
MRSRVAIVVAALLTAWASLGASGGILGIFGVIDRAVFEPDEARAERIQLWGVFGYADCCGGLSKVERGYLYFKLPSADSASGTNNTRLVRNEWADLKSVAGTGQAVGFGFWDDSGQARGLRPGARISSTAYQVEFLPVNATQKELRVRPASEKPESPAEYHTDIGVVKLSPVGNNAEIVRLLKEPQQR